MPSKRYADRKARMARDPEYKRRVLAAQAESRRKARLELLDQSRDTVCGFPYPNGRHCWKGYAHTHGGEVYDPLAQEIAGG